MRSFSKNSFGFNKITPDVFIGVLIVLIIVFMMINPFKSSFGATKCEILGIKLGWANDTYYYMKNLRESAQKEIKTINRHNNYDIWLNLIKIIDTLEVLMSNLASDIRNSRKIYKANPPPSETQCKNAASTLHNALTKTKDEMWELYK